MKLPDTRLREEAAEHELGATNSGLTRRANVIRKTDSTPIG
jgi:hypothetical protein